MKKIILFVFLVVSSINQINAQEKGNTLLGGSFKYLSENIDEGVGDQGLDNSSQFTISPVIGYMVNDKVAIGTALNYTELKSDYYYGKIENQTLTIAPFVRIHNNITENLKYYIEPSIGKTFILGDSDNKDNIYNIGVNFGLLYFFVKNMSLELNIGGANYVSVSNKEYNYKNNTLSIDYDLVTPNIGFKYYF